MAASGGGGVGTPKAVTIAEPESISPLLQPIGEEDANPTAPPSPKLRRASMAKRLSGRASVTPSSLLGFSGSPKPIGGEDGSGSEMQNDPHSKLVIQIMAWLVEEKAKQALRRKKSAEDSGSSAQHVRDDGRREANPSILSEPDAEYSLKKLEQIVSESIEYARKFGPRPSADFQGYNFPRRKSSAKLLRKGSTVPTASSDTDYQDGDAIVPSADVILDNSKTLSYSGGGANTDPDLTSDKALRSQEGWNTFKYEIVRLTHTLRLKGWRRVSLDLSSSIEVTRLSGALTNAVYVVSPPKDLPATTPSGDGDKAPSLKRNPPKLLLRIYGPQVEHLIDRDVELQILRRLARQNIGPRLLGTFENGRFEQFFNAKTLTASDLRNPETSKQIAKRMRELHEGIELLPSERDAGPFVWQNWDKWVARCEEVITWLDQQIVSHQGPIKKPSEGYKARGFICGVEWARFRKAVDNYRKWLDQRYGGRRGTRSQLVFAHNDTQYGNLLRLEPSGTSPLLMPANEHKQLVVIDFEYANANTPGLEFANHFTEWCYNYHSPDASYACNAAAYPTPDEQKRFIKAYVQHVPGYNIKSPESRPTLGSSSSISNFMLDSRAPPASSYDNEEKAREEKMHKEVERLTQEARLWRVANSAMWVAWGIVQAKVPGMDEALKAQRKSKRKLAERLVAKLIHPRHGQSGEVYHQQEDGTKDVAADGTSASTDRDQDTSTKASEIDAEIALEALKLEESVDAAEEELHVPHEHEIDDEADFDYLAYAQERAMFFWGDLLELDLIKEDELPEMVRQHAKRVSY